MQCGHRGSENWRVISKIVSAEEIGAQGLLTEHNSGIGFRIFANPRGEDGGFFQQRAKDLGLAGAICGTGRSPLPTDSNAPQASRISYLLVELKRTGITVRPLVQMSGRHWFNESVSTDRATPKKFSGRRMNNGWQVAINAPMFERARRGGQPLISVGERTG